MLLACLGGCIGESSTSASNTVFGLSGLAFLGTIGVVGLICWSYVAAGSALRQALASLAAIAKA